MPCREQACPPDEIDRLFAQAIEEDGRERERHEGVRMEKRLAVGFVLVMATGAMCWVVLPQFGLVLPWPVILAIFATIAFAILAPILERRPAPAAEQDARPVCCSGPRPVGERSRCASQDANRRYTGDCGTDC